MKDKVISEYGLKVAGPAVVLSGLWSLPAIAARDYGVLQREIEQYVAARDARIGVSVIVEGCDTVSVNGDECFPMMSVFKFPVALAVAERCRGANVGFDEQVSLTEGDLHRDTWSPMVEVYADSVPTRVSLMRLLAYSLQQSDNNAADILLRYAGGAERVTSLMPGGIEVRWSEDEMHRDINRSFENVSTPRAMAALFDRFDVSRGDTLSAVIKCLLEGCATGEARLPAPLRKDGVVIGHKTGSGWTLADGRLTGINDAGYVHLPDGRRYSIAVFVTDADYDMAGCEAIIADISGIVYNSITSGE